MGRRRNSMHRRILRKHSLNRQFRADTLRLTLRIMHSLLIIGKVWPESTTTGAGVRMMQLIDSFRNSGYSITFASAAQKSDHSEDLTKLGVDTVMIELNSDNFKYFSPSTSTSNCVV